MSKKPKHVIAENAELMIEWDFEKNTELGLDPLLIGVGSHTKAWWKCKTCGYEWYGSINHRVHRRGCPYCNHRVVVSGKNDLASLRPDLLKEWDYEKNTINPAELAVRSGKKAYWKCSVCGNEWVAVIASRAAGAGCPKWRDHKKKKEA